MIKKIMFVLLAIFLMVMAVASASAQVTLKQVNHGFFNDIDEGVTKLIDFEDNPSQPDLDYLDTHGVSFQDDTGKTSAILVNSYNRGGAATASGEYSLFSNGNYPATSANVPLTIEFNEGMSAVGFYLGNGNKYGEQVNAVVTAYGQTGKILGTIAQNHIDDSVESFLGLQAPTEPIYKVTIDYGNSVLGEEIDDLMFIRATGSFQEVEGPVTFEVSVNDYPDHQNYDLSKAVPFSYINMYTVELQNGEFTVVDVETKNTGKSGATSFTIDPAEKVYFAGFKTKAAAEQGAQEKQSTKWSAPPFKNFGVEDQLCQTNFAQINEYLQNSKSYACSTSLSVPYQDADVIVENQPANKWVWKEIALKNKHKSPLGGVEVDVVPMDGLEAVPSECTEQYGGKVCVDKAHLLVRPDGSYEYVTLWITIDGFSDAQVFGLDTDDAFVKLLENKDIEVWFNPQQMKLRIANNAQPDGEISQVDASDAKYIVWTRSNDKAARGIVAKYIQQGSSWILASTTKSKLVDATIVSPTGSKQGKSYRGDVEVAQGEVVRFLSFDPDSEIPKKLTNLNQNSMVPAWLAFKGTSIDGKVKVCSLTEGCSKVFSSHASENLYYENGQFKTIYDKKNIAVGKINPIINQEIIKQAPPTPLSCAQGCDIDEGCLPLGTRMKEDSKAVYCDVDGQLKPQQKIGAICENNFECTTNSCLSGQCTDLKQELSVQRGLMERILEWFNRLF